VPGEVVSEVPADEACATRDQGVLHLRSSRSRLKDAPTI
jgi:hypothetical protein